MKKYKSVRVYKGDVLYGSPDSAYLTVSESELEELHYASEIAKLCKYSSLIREIANYNNDIEKRVTINLFDYYTNLDFPMPMKKLYEFISKKDPVDLTEYEVEQISGDLCSSSVVLVGCRRETSKMAEG